VQPPWQRGISATNKVPYYIKWVVLNAFVFFCRLVAYPLFCVLDIYCIESFTEAQWVCLQQNAKIQKIV
jgi:uncharacterized metal-binding protein